jgi:hypothetical protein
MLVKFTLAGDGSQPLHFLEQNEERKKAGLPSPNPPIFVIIRGKYEKGKIKKIQFAKRIFKNLSKKII